MRHLRFWPVLRSLPEAWSQEGLPDKLTGKPHARVSDMAWLCLIAMLLAWAQARGEIQTAMYEYPWMALHLKHGGNLGFLITEAPLYALAILGLTYLGLAPLTAALGLSLVCFGLSAAMVYRLAATFCENRLAGWAAGLLMICVPPGMELAMSINAETLFILACLAAFALLDHWLRHLAGHHEHSRWGLAVAAGLTLALPFWTRYIGLLVPLFATSLFILFWMRPPPRRRAELTIALVALTAACGLLFFRNYYYGGTLSGHVLGIKPGETLFTGLVKCLYLTAGDWLYPLARFNYWSWKVLVAVLMLAAWLAALHLLRERARAWLFAAFPLCYLFAVSFAASITRIDELNSRFTLPAYPFLSLAVVFCAQRLGIFAPGSRRHWREIGSGIGLFLLLAIFTWALGRLNWHDLRPQADWPKVAYLGTTMLGAIAGAVLVLAWGQRGNAASPLHPPARLRAIAGLMFAALVVLPGFARVANEQAPSANWSPITIAYIEKEIPRGSVLVVNRLGSQLQAASADYTVCFMPSLNPQNGTYDEDYGIVRWTRTTALDAFTQNRATYVVFFFGSAGADSLLRFNAYGDYVPSLLSQPLPEVRRVIRLADGVVVELQPIERLRAIRGEIPVQATN